MKIPRFKEYRGPSGAFSGPLSARIAELEAAQAANVYVRTTRRQVFVLRALPTSMPTIRHRALSWHLNV